MTMPDYGPFSVDAEEISRIGIAGFSSFINRLLAAETAAHGMAGSALETTYKQNTPDGGVDARLLDAVGTAWIPAGDSAWQFKSADLGPAACRRELLGATFALDTLREGGAYRLVLGASLNAQQLGLRRSALKQAAASLGIWVGDRTIDIVGADSVARWVELYPALAVSPLLRGIGMVGQTFEQWSRSIRHQTLWAESAVRNGQIAAIRQVVTGAAQIDVHVSGTSGLGKTRLVMEALRGQDVEPLVLYAPSADQFPIAVLAQLGSQERTAVVVVDECDEKTHEIYAQLLSAGTRLRLVTIGEPGGVSTRTPMIGLLPLEDDAMGDVLRRNEPRLWPEAERVIVGLAAGNVDYGLKAAKALLAHDAASAGSLVTADDIRQFITDQLPDGALFFACCALAMFTRIGFEGEVAQDLAVIADGIGLQVDQIRDAGAALENIGLLTRQGRYRSVGPHPLAVYLASRGWERFGGQVVAELLPKLGADLAARLFRRAADVGEFDPASPAVMGILAVDGPLSSLESLAAKGNSDLLTPFTIMAPCAVGTRLVELIEDASNVKIRGYDGIRRNLVWALEKLAWHSRTFELGANGLLRLALVETENFSNNATGAWVALFGAMLPGTAAAPTMRLDYLAAAARSTDVAVRNLVAKAASHALEPQESIMVSAEVQGGAVVEPRGTPATFGDVWAYRRSSIRLLRNLVDDPDFEVSEVALGGLLAGLQGSLEVESIRTDLAAALSSLPPRGLLKARSELDGLASLYSRVGDEDEQAAAVDAILAMLPKETPEERLWVLAHANPWDRDSDDLASELRASKLSVGADRSEDVLFGILETEEVASAHEIGRVLAGIGIDPERTRSRMARLVEGAHPANVTAVVGYLRALVDGGATDAYDDFVEESASDADVRLRLTAAGPQTLRAASRVDELLPAVPVRVAARALFGWVRDVSEPQVAAYIESWIPRIESQDDYNAAVDLLAFHLHGKSSIGPEIDSVCRELAPLRRGLPQMGQQGWDWVRIVERWVADDPLAVTGLLADLIEADALQAHSGSEESRLLQRAVAAGGEEAWTLLMSRLADGSWRLSWSVRGWLGSAVPVDVAERWVGADLERARLLASVSSVGGAELSEIGRFLLNAYGHDVRVSSSLVGEFISGAWSGKESDHLRGQIEQVRHWLEGPDESDAVRRWVGDLERSLEAERARALQREAEDYW